MSSSEFTDWQAFDAIDPLPDRRQEYYLAQLAQILFNVNRGPAQKALEIDDFLLFKTAPARSPEDVEQNLRMIFGAMVATPKEP